MTQFVNVSFLCVPVHEDITEKSWIELLSKLFKILQDHCGYHVVCIIKDDIQYDLQDLKLSHQAFKDS